MDFSGDALWGVMTILGPILLALAILWALANNRRTRAEKDASERAVHEQKAEKRHEEGIR
jgi:hypothetical protein